MGSAKTSNACIINQSTCLFDFSESCIFKVLRMFFLPICKFFKFVIYKRSSIYRFTTALTHHSKCTALQWYICVLFIDIQQYKVIQIWILFKIKQFLPDCASANCIKYIQRIDTWQVFIAFKLKIILVASINIFQFLECVLTNQTNMNTFMIILITKLECFQSIAKRHIYTIIRSLSVISLYILDDELLCANSAKYMVL